MKNSVKVLGIISVLLISTGIMLSLYSNVTLGILIDSIGLTLYIFFIYLCFGYIMTLLIKNE